PRPAGAGIENEKTTATIVPMVAIWRRGARLSRPAAAGLPSPSSAAAPACTASWMVTLMINARKVSTTTMAFMETETFPGGGERIRFAMSGRLNAKPALVPVYTSGQHTSHTWAEVAGGQETHERHPLLPKAWLKVPGAYGTPLKRNLPRPAARRASRESTSS